MFGFLKKSKILVTHNGSFHADDVFACAILQIYLDKAGEKYEIVRTRDQADFDRGDFVFDVGGIYDPSKDRFDHHQKGRAGTRENGIYYAACGLVWKKYGPLIAGAEVADALDKKIFQALDAVDNGQDLSKNIFENVFPYSVPSVVGAYNLSWKEDDSAEYGQFIKASEWAKEVVKREIVQMQSSIESEKDVLGQYSNASDKRLVILEKPYSRQEINRVLVNFSEPVYFIYPKSDGSGWKIEAVRVSSSSFESRKQFPAEWAGLRDEDFQKASGVADAYFAHDGRFYCVAKSKEGTLALANKALNS